MSEWFFQLGIPVFSRFLPFSVNVISSKSFMKASSRQDYVRAALTHDASADNWGSLRGSTSETFTEEYFGPLSNVR